MKTFSTIVILSQFVITSFLVNASVTAQPEYSPLTKDLPTGRQDTAYSFDNVPIVYQKAGDGKQVLVFVHGWSCDKSYWENQLEYFGKDYTVIAIDLAGHGESGMNRKEWTIGNYGKDVKAVVEKENLDDVILIGHSMGGAVVLSAAQQLGDKVKVLIGIDTFHDIEQKYTDEQINEFYSPFEKDFKGTTKEFVKGMFPENADSNLVVMISSDMSSAPPEIALASFKDLFKFDEAKNFDESNIPVRFLNGNDYPTNVESAKKHIKDFDVKIMKDVGHFLMIERPVEFNKLLAETIEELDN